MYLLFERFFHARLSKVTHLAKKVGHLQLRSIQGVFNPWLPIDLLLLTRKESYTSLPTDLALSMTKCKEPTFSAAWPTLPLLVFSSRSNHFILIMYRYVSYHKYLLVFILCLNAKVNRFLSICNFFNSLIRNRVN